ESPYLLQHVSDPVDWYPWGQDAFAKAQKENKPIFLSIGYASCYWCHTMDTAVFQNKTIAAQLNDYAISVLVDREERPDIDRLYRSALQVLSGSTGCPMSLFLTPDRRPFYGATYLPASGFVNILNRVHELWITDPENVSDFSIRMTAYLNHLATSETKKQMSDEQILRRGFEGFRKIYNSSGGSKIPSPAVFTFLLSYYKRTGDQAAQDLAFHTLQTFQHRTSAAEKL